MSVAIVTTKWFPHFIALRRHSFVMLVLWLFALSGITPPAARAVPGYDAQPISGLPSSAFGSLLSQFNLDGAFAYAHYDDARQAWVIGIWTPRPLYGRAAGYTELSTYPGAFGAAGVWPFIDNAGNVTYYSVNGGTYGSSSGAIPIETVPNWNDSNVIFRDFAFRGILGWATSDPAPHAGFFASVTTRDGNSFQPSFTYDYSGKLESGLQIQGRPWGEFGSVEIINRLGHQVWIVYDARTDLPGRVRNSDSRRAYAITPLGVMQIAEGYFLSGRGDVKFATSDPAPGGLAPNTHYILLAGPLGPLGPGFHRQSDIPGMPAQHWILKMNSSGTFITVAPDIALHVLNGGKSAPLTALLPPTVPRMRRSSQLDVAAINEAGMLDYIVWTEQGGLRPVGRYLLTPALDCDVALSGAQPYRIGEEFDLDVTVRNVAGAAVTNVRVEGDTLGSPGLVVSAPVHTPPGFDIVSGPSPATPLTLAPGAEQVIRYRCRATRSGTGDVTAKVKATAASGNALRCEAKTPIAIEVRGDLLVKLSEEPAGAFALDNVYQRTAPSGAQDRKVEILSEGQTRAFEVKVQNDEPGPLTLRVFSLETGSTAIPARYFFGTNDITDAIKTTAWTTPELATGASVTFRVEFGPTDGALGGETRAARLTLSPVDSSAPCDLVRVETVNAPPVEVALRKGSATGLTTQSIEAGKGHMDAPLVFKTDPAALRVETAVRRGLVADGVTPLLLELSVKPETLAGLPNGIDYQLALEIAEGGTLEGAPAGQRLRVLKDGAWQSLGQIKFSETQNVHFASITPVKADDLRLAGGATEMKLRLRFTQPGTGAFVTDKTVLLRRPPVVLVHGYNTGGNWGADFVRTLRASRAGDFIRVIRYGQEPATALDFQKLNTVLPFGPLARMVDVEIRRELIEIAEACWAFTRIDYIGHSQGGVLGRMLCSKNGNSFLPLPFRNVENHYRGRFHRVVTVGSPHNGTRLVSYMSRLKDRLAPGSTRSQAGIAGDVSKLMIWTGVSQSKFDPFGPDIRLLQSPDPTAPWQPDPGAMFHLVQTTVNHGASPSSGNATYAEAALGLDSPNGPLVIPRGSDGVVDFDSMTATTPEAGQSPPPNSYRMPASRQIAHAHLMLTLPGYIGTVSLFGSTEGQVDSIAVGEHVTAALDQDPALLAQNRVFGPFRLAVPLPQSVADSLETAAARVTPGLLESIGFAGGGQLTASGGAGAGGPEARLIEFYPPPGETLARPVTWMIERYGENGVTTEGVSLLSAGDPARVWVQVDTSVWGDVVIYGTALMASGDVVTGAPFLVTSSEPRDPEWTLDGIEVRPGDGAYAAGTGVEPELWARYFSGESGGEISLQRWIVPEEISVNSFNPSVVDVGNPRAWQMGPATGQAGVQVDWRGFGTSASFTVFPETANGPDDDGDGLANVDEADVPNRNGGPATGDGNGDGVPDHFQNRVASLRTPDGRWLTLQAPADGLNGVALAPAPADTASLPGRYAFDHGFLTFSQFLATPGASIDLTVFLPRDADLTTVWAYGPTPGNAAPHWYEFLFDGQTGAEILTNRVVLHLRDGARGDSDATADSTITGVTLGLARLIPELPPLRIVLDPPDRHAVAWPGVFPNAARTYLEFTDGLAPSSQWQFVPEAAMQTSDGENRLTGTNTAAGLFYRLRGQ